MTEIESLSKGPGGKILLSYFRLWIFKMSKLMLRHGSECLSSSTLAFLFKEKKKNLKVNSKLIRFGKIFGNCAVGIVRIHIRKLNHSLQKCFPTTRSPTLAPQHPSSQLHRLHPTKAFSESCNKTFYICSTFLSHLIHASTSWSSTSLYNSCRSWMETRFRFHDARRRNVPFRNFCGKMEKSFYELPLIIPKTEKNRDAEWM